MIQVGGSETALLEAALLHIREKPPLAQGRSTNVKHESSRSFVMRTYSGVNAVFPAKAGIQEAYLSNVAVA